MSDKVSPIRPLGGIMSEFEVLAQHLLKEAEAEEKLRQENDKKSLSRKCWKSMIRSMWLNY